MQLRIVETVLRDGKMVVDTTIKAVRAGKIHPITEYNFNPDSVDIVFQAWSGTALGVDKSSVQINPDGPAHQPVVSNCCH